MLEKDKAQLLEELKGVVREEHRALLEALDDKFAGIAERLQQLETAGPAATHSVVRRTIRQVRPVTEEEIKAIGSEWWTNVDTNGRHAIRVRRVVSEQTGEDGVKAYGVRKIDGDGRGPPIYRTLDLLYRSEIEATSAPRASSASRSAARD